MTRDEIYDHLAQVYLGKRKESDARKKRPLGAWLFINILITGIIFISAFYGLTAFLAHNSVSLQKNVIFSLHNGLVRMDYNFNGDFPPVKTLALAVPPEVEADKYQNIRFSIRTREPGKTGVVKIVVKNKKNEEAAYYIRGIDSRWQDYRVPLDAFSRISDWSGLRDVSFVLESWNMEEKEGVILIDNICFSG